MRNAECGVRSVERAAVHSFPTPRVPDVVGAGRSDFLGALGLLRIPNSAAFRTFTSMGGFCHVKCTTLAVPATSGHVADNFSQPQAQNAQQLGHSNMRCKQHVNMIGHHHQGVQRVGTERVLAIAKRTDHNRRDFRAAPMEGPRPFGTRRNGSVFVPTLSRTRCERGWPLQQTSIAGRAPGRKKPAWRAAPLALLI